MAMINQLLCPEMTQCTWQKKKLRLFPRSVSRHSFSLGCWQHSDHCKLPPTSTPLSLSRVSQCAAKCALLCPLACLSYL